MDISKIEWDKEDPSVKESIDFIVKAYDIYKSMPPQEQQRFDYLLEWVIPKEGES